MNTLQGIIIAIVEGITEFLPVSSTGHMIIAQKLLGIEPNEFVNLFTINIQFGAIISVIILYYKKFLEPVKKVNTTGSWMKKNSIRFDFYLKLFVAVIPAAIFGLLFNDTIESLLGNVMIVAIALILGGIVLIFVDKWFKNTVEENDITYPKAFKIGVFQVISMIPGVSRAAATIIGGLTQRLSRKSAAEFSFFLAVPTMFGASVIELYKNFASINSSNIHVLIIGNVVAFVVALLAIKGFISFLTKHGFRMFGYYRILVGLVILILLALGVDLNMMG